MWRPTRASPRCDRRRYGQAQRRRAVQPVAGIVSKTADSRSVVSQGSTLQAGGNLNLTSTRGDIHVVQGNLSAGNTVSLDSARDILLEAG